MIFFGLYCLLIGRLTFQSTYLPRILGVLLVYIGGLGYLVNSSVNFLAPAFASHLFPYILLPGFTAETVLCLWLLVKGLDCARWDQKERVAVGGMSVRRPRLRPARSVTAISDPAGQ